MNNKEQSPLYATLFYDAREKLNISIAEYFYLDMIHKLSYNRWCIKSLENCAYDMGISKRGLMKMRDRLIDRGYLQKNDSGGLKVTQTYIEVAVNKVHPVDNFRAGAVNKVPNAVNLVHSIGELSSPKNNNRIKENIKRIEKKEPVDKSSSIGYVLAKARASWIKQKPGISFDEWFRDHGAGQTA